MYNRNPTDLTHVLSADAIIATGILEDPIVRSNLLRLLPEGQQSDEYLETNLRSPQFQQALDALGSALSSDSFNSVMANLGIDPAPGANWLVSFNPCCLLFLLHSFVISYCDIFHGSSSYIHFMT
jgi:hypothetical protein